MRSALGFLLVAAVVYGIADALPTWLDAGALGLCLGLILGRFHRSTTTSKESPDVHA